jgi:hypothetical protein
MSCPVIRKNRWAADRHVTGAAQQFRTRLRLATLVVEGNKVAATLPSGKAGQTVLKKKRMQTQIQEILHFIYMHLAHYNPN